MNNEIKVLIVNGKEEKVVNVPVMNIKVMDDEQWNRLAYQNMIERGVFHE